MGPASVRTARKAPGSESAAAVGNERSRNRVPSSSPQRSMLTVPGSIPMTRGIVAQGCFATSSRATSAIASASRTRSLRVKRRAIHALWSLVLKFPTPNAPNTATPSFMMPASLTSTPSIPRGGTAFKSTAILRVFTPVHAARGAIWMPAAPALRSTAAPSRVRGSCDGSARVALSTWTLKRALMNWRALSPCSGRDRHAGAILGEEAGGALADRAGTGEDHDLLVRRAAECLLDLDDGGHRGRVRPVRVQHERH